MLLQFEKLEKSTRQKRCSETQKIYKNSSNLVENPNYTHGAGVLSATPKLSYLAVGFVRAARRKMAENATYV
jgi:hypothetical protein